MQKKSNSISFYFHIRVNASRPNDETSGRAPFSLYRKKMCSKPDNEKTKFKAFFYEKSTDVFFFFLITHLLKDQNYEMCFQFSCFLFFH